MTTNIKNFYLNMPLNHFEYMCLALDILPEEIIIQYNLCNIIYQDGYIFLELWKGMYGLPQVGILANKCLTTHLATFGYISTTQTPGLWQHPTHHITFSLVVDNFGIKYVGCQHTKHLVERQNAKHLVDTLKALYLVTTDWGGLLYCGLTLR